MTKVAYCFPDGVIHIEDTCPEGALTIAKGPENILRQELEVTSRQAYDNKTMLVPGIPEASDQMEGVEALIRYVDWLKKRATSGISFE